jgi:IclR family transcriptional regulator, KDG regulon repressor
MHSYIRNGADASYRSHANSGGPTSSGTQVLSSVAMAVRLLKCFSDENFELGIGALAGRLGIAKSTAHRLASTLVQGGLLEQVRETSKYRPGVLLFELGSLVRRKVDVYRDAKDILRDLRTRTDETVNLAVLSDGSVVYLNSLESRRAIKVVSTLGMRMPAHCSAEGKVMLAFGPPEIAERLLLGELVRRTGRTITDPVALRTALAEVRERGYAIDDEEGEVGAKAVAVPVFGVEGLAVAAIGIAGPIQRLTRRAITAYLPLLYRAAVAVGQQRSGYALTMPRGHALEER